VCSRVEEPWSWGISNCSMPRTDCASGEFVAGGAAHAADPDHDGVVVA
jgi:hypothetical protein